MLWALYKTAEGSVGALLNLQRLRQSLNFIVLSSFILKGMLSAPCAALFFVLLALVEGAPSTTADIASGDDTNKGYCSGYRPGNPALASDVENCRSGSEIGVVGHSYAFGLDPLIQSPNWTSCGIPTLPGEKYVQYCI